jgi:23S rRNA (cytidine1920-2'-O)/16S rRNA (cytidine1409-2'-O)-methyltransferase
MTGRTRLDQALVERGYYQTRSRARDAILRGAVMVGGVAAAKPSQSIDSASAITLCDPAAGQVSRAALKLQKGLEQSGHDPAGLIALDIGASTGGFTQVLLERGAARVFAIDVGHGQLHQSLRDDPRVVAVEGLNARDLAPADLGGERPQIIVCDVSFISLKLALPPALAMAAPGAKGIFLIKPQFEAGRDAIGKNGILRDPSLGEQIAAGIATWLNEIDDWRTGGLCPSPIEGGDGNREFLVWGSRSS